LLIIFDLDDTLIQTTLAITPWKIGSALAHLVRQEVLKEGLDELMFAWAPFHSQYETSSLGLVAFLKNRGVNEKHIQETLEVFSSLDESIPVEVFEGVYPLLEELKKIHTLALVTSGERDHQSLKMSKAGLAQGYFNHIEIAVDKIKKSLYEKFKLEYPDQAIWVIGDRVEKDLIPAKQLGFKTVLVRQGRGQYQKFDPMWVDYVIEDVTELLSLVKS